MRDDGTNMPYSSTRRIHVNHHFVPTIIYLRYGMEQAAVVSEDVS
jgi:hypothetical protein